MHRVVELSSKFQLPRPAPCPKDRQRVPKIPSLLNLMGIVFDGLRSGPIGLDKVETLRSKVLTGNGLTRNLRVPKVFS